MKGFARAILVLAAFLAVGCAFFLPAADNDFWHSDDFLSLEHSLRMEGDRLAAFDSAPPYKFQPLVYELYYLLFERFRFEPRGYLLFNILLHGMNSLLVYILVNTLLRDRTVAVVSGLLFVFTVGSYGKAVMIVSGLDDLVVTFLTLLTMIFYFKNELGGGGRLRSPWFALALFFFVASMFTRTTSLAILGAFLAFGFFFRHETERVIGGPFVVLAVIAAAALAVKTVGFHYAPPLYTENPGPVKFVLYAAKNTISYIVRMIFPIHTSNLVTEAGTAVRFIYRFATEIRILIAITVISYSFFGFIFGNHTIRFFIAWTYIMVLPFAFFQFPRDWLNIRHLYLVSIGFSMVLAAGAVYCSRLIAHHRWRRYVPFAVPVFFVLLSRFIVAQLDHSYERKALDPALSQHREEIARRYPQVRLEGDTLRYVGKGDASDQ